MTQPVLKPVPARAPLTSLVRRGRQQVPLRLFIHGMWKTGKSTCASGAPAPLFLPIDDGVELLDVDKLPKPRDWDHAIELVRAVADDPGDYKTFVIDPINLLEPMCWAKVTAAGGVKSIEDFGYGKGYTAAVDYWRVLLSEIERVWRRGLNVIIVAHSATTNFKNPEGPDYARFTPALNEKAAGLFSGWVDAILFARVESGAKQEGKQRARGVSTGMRLFQTTWSAPWEAGNRWSLPETIPLGWVELQGAIEAAERSAEALRADIMRLAEQLGPDAIARAKSYVNAAGSRVDRLREVLNALQMKIQEKESEK